MKPSVWSGNRFCCILFRKKMPAILKFSGGWLPLQRALAKLLVMRVLSEVSSTSCLGTRLKWALCVVIPLWYRCPPPRKETDYTWPLHNPLHLTPAWTQYTSVVDDKIIWIQINSAPYCILFLETSVINQMISYRWWGWRFFWSFCENEYEWPCGKPQGHWYVLFNYKSKSVL